MSFAVVLVRRLRLSLLHSTQQERTLNLLLIIISKSHLLSLHFTRPSFKLGKVNTIYWIINTSMWLTLACGPRKNFYTGLRMYIFLKIIQYLAFQTQWRIDKIIKESLKKFFFFKWGSIMSNDNSGITRARIKFIYRVKNVLYII